MRGALLLKYSKNVRQLEDIIELQEQFNRICAQRSRETRLSFEAIEQFLALTRAAFDEIKESPSWKILLKYPKYWHLAEAHAMYFAPSETPLREAIKEIGQTAAP